MRLSNKLFKNLRLAKKQKEGINKNEWTWFCCGEVNGWVKREVAIMFIDELKRLQQATGSDKLTPNVEAMTQNSATTPLESLV